MQHYRELEGSVKNSIKYLIPDSIRRLIHRRQFQCFCIGTPKSGTTSIAGLFDKHFRSSHEPERRPIIHFINDHYLGKITDDEYVEWLKKRDKRVWLDMESNCFLGYRIDLLYRAFPEAKYILSVRSPKSWLDSMLNHTINYPPSSEVVIQYWHSIFFKPDEYPFSEKDKILAEYKVYSIKSYLNYWANSVKSVLDTIPAEQLLIIKTQDFNDSLSKIASFLDVDENKFDIKSGHLNKAPNKFHLLDKVESAYVDELIETICGDLKKRLEL